MSDENKTKEELLNELYYAWEGAVKGKSYGGEKEYIATKDKDALKKGVELSHFYQTHVVPLPFWGNIYDPEYIVLSHNPSCEPIVDELESLFFYNELKNTLNKRTGISEINWLDEKFDLKNILYSLKDIDDNQIKEFVKNEYKVSLNEECDAIITLKKQLSFEKSKEDGSRKPKLTSFKTTYDWWNEVFADDNAIEKIIHACNDDKIDRKKMYEGFGFFNLCGYHSRSYETIKQKYIDKERLKKDLKYIPTVDAMIKYVKHLIKSNKFKKIIIIWGTEWKRYIFEAVNPKNKTSDDAIKKCIEQLIQEEKLIIVNKNQGRSKRLKNE